jgi:hypothetical protein
MGVCQSGSSNASDQTLVFSEQDINATYQFIFDAIVKAASSMLELEVVSKQLLMPPSDQLIYSLSAVAAVDIISSQLTLQPHEFKLPSQVVTQKNAPAQLKELIAAMLQLKGHMLKLGNFAVLTSAGDIHRIKQQILNVPSAEFPMKAWGSCMQKYEDSLFAANAVAAAISRLPRYLLFKASTSQNIEEMARNTNANNVVTYFYEKDNSDDDDDEDSPSRPRQRGPPRGAYVTSPTGNTAPPAAAVAKKADNAVGPAGSKTHASTPLQVDDFDDDDV